MCHNNCLSKSEWTVIFLQTESAPDIQAKNLADTGNRSGGGEIIAGVGMELDLHADGHILVKR